jgi:8-hydroxy-5-deazaflavin:NADPH oxidoreductase
MNIGLLGTGMVGRTIAGKLVEVGNEVKMGSRTPDNASAAEWVAATGSGASQGTFADAAAFGEVVFNCTSGSASLTALEAAGAENLEGKVLVDVSNALAFTEGVPFPTGLFVDTTESQAERIQAAVPGANVVKTLNTMTADLMVDPSKVPGPHDVFVAGDEERAKEQVKTILRSFGWADDRIVDLGDLTGARGMELYVILWLRLFQTLGTPFVNVHVAR